MSSANLSEPARESLLGRFFLAVGSKIVPRGIVGGLTLTLPSGTKHRIGFERPGVTCDLKLHNFRPVWSAMRRGAVGFAESYMAGDLDSLDITAVLRFYLQNRHVLDQAAKPVFYKSLADRLFHMMRSNTRDGARRNISEHYDLGNAFYAQWLDCTMSYSSAYFGDGANSLEAAQKAKYDLVFDALDVAEGGHILEIGCGWGGFAETAAVRGCQVTGITISREQLDFASRRLDGRAELRFEDYRDTSGSFDAIASIEMIEAVGEAHWPSYFNVLRDRLKPGCCAAVQAITIDERFYEGYRTTTDFIQRYIFPGGMLPTRLILAEQARLAGLVFEPLHAFGQDYARTLIYWRERFEASWAAISQLGFDEEFRRRWRYYLCYCEAGFGEQAIDVGIYRFRRSG
jgi:cyclopropane-fatty-acyl-phospholipid synthase